MNKLQLLSLLPIWLASIASAANLEGSISWNFKCKDLDALHPQTKVVLDGGRYKASIRKDGHFTFFNVQPGSYLLEVLARDHEFDPLRVEVLSVPKSSTSVQLEAHVSTTISSAAAEPSSTNKSSDDDEEALFKAQPPSTPSPSEDAPSTTPVEVEIRPAVPGTPFHPAGSPHFQALPLLPYPIVLASRGQKLYDVPQKGFDVLEMFKNPMMMMMLLAGAMIFVLPKALESMDPEIVKDMRERQDKMYNLQSSIQNGDFGALKAELLQRVDGPPSSSAKPRTTTDAASGSGSGGQGQSSGASPSASASGSGKKGGAQGGRKKR